MKITRTDRSSTAVRRLARAGVTAAGLGLTAALALSGCAQSDVGGSTGAGSGNGDSSASSTPEESDMTSPSPSDGAEKPRKLPQAADMEIVAGDSGRGLPPGLEGSTDSTVGVAWSPESGLLYVVTNGSSSCPTFPEPDATIGAGGAGGKIGGVAAEDGVLTVTFVPESDGICTMDFVPTTTVVETPPESDNGRPVPVVLGDKGKVELQPRGTDGEPGPIAWLDS